MKKAVLAFDFGASSGRGLLGLYEDGRFELQEIHRFENQPKKKNGQLVWAIDYLFEQIIIGIKKAQQEQPIDSIGVDTWGVDFGLLDKAGQLLGAPVHYRDARTAGLSQQVAERLSAEYDLYGTTGNQLMDINTLFQLVAVQQREPELLAAADQLLLMPDLLNYLLTGKAAAERSIASTTQMMNVHTKKWDTELLEKLGLPVSLLPKVVSEGNILGMTKPELGIGEIPVINVCEHDTASAVVSVPSNQRFLFISCGTWSLVGTELPEPVVNGKARRYNLTNESGNSGTTRFLKNCTGLWIIQELKRNLAAQGIVYSYSEISRLACEAPEFGCLIDTDDPVFTAPGDMIQRIQLYAEQTAQAIPQTHSALFRCAYESLAFKYKYTFLEITDSINQEFDTVNIVGGGAQAEILCQMVADASNLRVGAGPVEATAIGNLLVQLIALGVLEDIQQARQWLKGFADIKYYFPKQTKKWDDQYTRYEKIIKRSEVERSNATC